MTTSGGDNRDNEKVSKPTSGGSKPPSETGTDTPETDVPPNGGTEDSDDEPEQGWFSKAVSWTRDAFGVNKPDPAEQQNRAREQPLTDNERLLFSAGGVLPSAEPGFQFFNFVMDGVSGLSDMVGYGLNIATGGLLFNSHASRFRGSVEGTAEALTNPTETLQRIMGIPDEINNLRANGREFDALALERQLLSLGLIVSPAGPLGMSKLDALNDAGRALLNGDNGALNNAEELAKAGQQADKNGLTKAGRALQKHGDREGSVFPKSTGSASGRNQQGQEILESILSSDKQHVKPNRFGGNDIYDSNTGRGARFDGEGNMKGFLEP